MALPPGFTLVKPSAAPEEKPAQGQVPKGFTLVEPKAEAPQGQVPEGFTLVQPPKETTIQAPTVEAKATARPVNEKSVAGYLKEADGQPAPTAVGNTTLRDMGLDTGISSKEDVLNQLVGPLKTTNPKVTKSLYDQAEKNYDFASSEAQKALRSGATKEQAAEIFANKLQAVAQMSSNGTMRYPDTTMQAVKNAITRGGLGFGRDVANIAALGAGAVGADTTSRELLGKSQQLSNIAEQYPGQFASSEEALAKGDTLEDKAKNMAMRALEGTIENAPSMLASIGGASGARLLATKGVEAYAAKYGRKASEELLDKAAKYGVASGALATSTGLEAGSIYQDIYTKTGELRPAVATAFGTLAGALDAIIPMKEANALNSVARKEMIDALGKTIAQRYGVNALKSMGIEGATEFFQTFIEKGGVSFVNGDPVFNKANTMEALDAAFIGTVMGGGTTLTSQAVQDLLMKTQGMSRADAKKYYESEQAATEARKSALDKWKTKGLTQKINLPTISPEAAAADQGQLFTQPGGTPTAAPVEHKDLVKQYIAQGQTKENAKLLADQDIADRKEAEDAGRIDSGIAGEGIQVSGQPEGEPVAGGVTEPVGAPVDGVGSIAGTTEDGTVQQPTALESTTGLAEAGSSMAKGAIDSLYEGLYGALEQGKNKFAGMKDPVLARAKPYFEAGMITSPQDLQNFENNGYPELPTQLATKEEVATKEEDPFKQRFEDFLGKTFKRQLMEASGQNTLDHMEENDISPQDVAKKFWDETYFNLPAQVQERFNSELKAQTGMEPGSVTHVDAKGNTIRAENWHDIADVAVGDIPNKAEYLEGTERGFVVLMNEANRRFSEQQTQEPVIEQQAPQIEQVAPQVSERERAAAERIRQQQEEAAAEKTAAAEEFKRTKVGAPPQAIAAEEQAPIEAVPEDIITEEEAPSPITTPEEDANFEKAKDTVGAFVRQTIGGVETLAPEDVVSAAQALASLADIMHHVIKKGARNFAQAMENARQGLGQHADAISKKQFKAAYDAAKARIKAEPKPAKTTKVDNILTKIARSESAESMGGAIGELIEADSWEDKKRVLEAQWETLTSKGIYTLLPALTTSQITDWVGDRIPHLTQVTRYTEKMSVMRSKMLAAITDIVDPWADYAKASIDKAKALSAMMHYATLAEVDPSIYNNINEALLKDSQLVATRKKMDAAQGAREKAAYKGQITTRQSKLTQAYKMWGETPAEGRRIFERVRDHYRTTFNLHRAILDERIQKSSVPGDINDASTPKGRLMAAIRQTYEDAKQIGVYFPLMRYGNYWMSLGSGINKEFYMFESETQRNLFLNKRIAQLQKAGDTRTYDEIMESGEFDAGNDLTKLRNLTAESSEMLQGIFKIIDTQGLSNKEELKDAVYQMYLMTMPEQSFRKQFIHRKGTTGFSGDSLRNFVRSGYATAGQLSRLKFGPDITLEMDAAHAALEGMPPKEKIKLGLFLNEVGTRVGEELSPEIEDQALVRFANGVNQAAFLWRLTSPKSAFANMTAIPVFGLPVLASRYGELKAAAMLARYGNVFNHTTFVTPDGKYTPLSVGMSKHVQSNRVLAAAFDEAAERGITEITRTYDLVGMARTPSVTHQNMVSRGVRAGINLAGILFHHSERLNREIMFMASFELAYNKAVKEGLGGGINGAAFNRAIDEAVKNTYDSMFNYSKYNRPRIMRSPAGRVVFQFKLFPQQVTAYLVRNFWTMLKGSDLNPRARREAITQFFGTIMMTGLFAGVVGLPLYSVIVGVLQGLRNALRDKDDPIPIEERDLDLWFRKWLGDNFGAAAASIEKGPVSALTNLDIASSTSLNNLWFRDTKFDPSMANQFNDFILNAAGPGAGLVQDTLKAYDDFRTGHFNEGVTKLLPAFAKGAYTQYVWGQEGIKVKGTQADIFDKYEVTKAERFWKAFGFNPTELTRIQEANYPAAELVARAKEERKKIMSRLDLELSREDDAAFENALQDAVRFTLANPQKDLRIDGQTIAKSAIARAKLRAMADRGLIVPASLMPQLYELVSYSRPKESKAEMQRKFDAKMKAAEAEEDTPAEEEE